MQTTDLQTQIDDLNRKLDFVVEELAHQRRRRMELEDLKTDGLIIARDLYQTTVEELEGVSEQVKPRDIIHLLKKLLRNVNNISATFDQLESLKDLLADLQPIGKEMYGSALVKLDELDRKGYFEFARQLNAIADDSVETLMAEDMDRLREHVPRLIRWLKSVTQPETLQSLETMIVALTRGEGSAREAKSLFGLMKEMNTPEARRGLAAFVEFVKGLGAPHGAPAENRDRKETQ